MLRSSPCLCRAAFTRPIGQFVLRKDGPSGCLRASIIAQARSSQGRLEGLEGLKGLEGLEVPKGLEGLEVPKPRQFTTCHPRLASPSPSPSPSFRPSPQEKAVPPAATTPASTTAPEIPPQDASPSPSPNPSPPSPKRRRRGLYYAALFLFLGGTLGAFARVTIAPPPLPVRGSDQDIYLQQKIQAAGAALPLVQQLSADPSWASWDAYSGISATPSPSNPQGLSAAQSRITSGPMSGSSGLAFQRIFYHAGTGEVVTVVYFGAGMSGWPNVVHGGALATVLDESLGRCAILRFPSRTGVTANLELQYRAPALTDHFYVIRTRPVAGDDDDVVGKDGVRKGDRKLWVSGTLETEKGQVAVEAKGLFVVPRGYQLRPLVEGF
ncbi:hypothetical protein F4859DRAFT_257389 [Xylaria cf. heliscus]|nr:hypothetical protein F4859DRAFT_257389 [Xylaria cf. heliscus]